jgi:hypothetical protein
MSRLSSKGEMGLELVLCIMGFRGKDPRLDQKWPTEQAIRLGGRSHSKHAMTERGANHTLAHWRVTSVKETNSDEEELLCFTTSVKDLLGCELRMVKQGRTR